MALTIRLPAKVIYPHDPLANLWRMQWLGPDLLELTFLLERIHEIKIPRVAVGRFGRDVRYGQEGEFRTFAANVVRGLKALGTDGVM